VFELRYRRMVEDALRADRRIGMVLLKPGYEDDYQGRPPIYPLGCAGRIVEDERLEDGRHNLVLLGQSRFRVIEERGGEPYRLAVVEELPESGGDESTLDVLRGRLLAVLSRLSDSPGVARIDADVPNAVLVNGLSQGLDLPAVERLSLLDCDTLEARARRLVELLEFHALEGGSGATRTLH
jgi:Lon protease-like protein